jgi:hypothetical protein
MHGKVLDLPQCFFVKKVRCDQDSVRQIYALITTRSRLRNKFPEFDLLMWDPGFNELERQAVAI